VSAALTAALTAAAVSVALPTSGRTRLRAAEARAGPPTLHGRAASLAGQPGRFRRLIASPRGASALAGLCVGLFVGSALGVALGFAVAVGAAHALSRLEPLAVRRRREQLAAELPAALDLLAACLAAGRPPGEALAAVTDAVGGPVAAELSIVSARLALGADPVAVWDGLTAHPVLAPLGRTMVRALETGAPVADGISRLVDDQRRNRRWDAEQRARSVGVQAAAPLALCFLPAFIAVGIVPTIAGALAQLLP
jgi:Flp pilus assembly protein TadB